MECRRWWLNQCTHDSVAAAVVGEGLGEELETAADRTGRRIRARTESLADPSTA